MKINWGTAIVLAFIGFIGFILFFVISMSTDQRAHHDLVTEDYYRAELAFQQEIDDQNNTNKNSVGLIVIKEEQGLLVQFPPNLDFSKIKGTLSLYRPSNKKLDFDIDLELSDSQILIPNNRLLEGRWDIKVSWEYGKESYLYKEKLTL
jgi:nitrogen fixation protein FixH